jgi:hypothetical protein
VGWSDYHFIVDWWVEGDIYEVASISTDVADVLRWWPAVYRTLEQLQTGDKDKVGMVLRVNTKGWLPYTLHWTLKISQVNYPFGFRIEAWGDLLGRGICTLEQVGPWTHVRYDWNVRAVKPLLRRLSLILRPVFIMNHHWAMRTGERSLQLEVLRRRARSPQEQAPIPLPPAPVSVVRALAAVVSVTALCTLSALVLTSSMVRVVHRRRGPKRPT